MPDPALHEVLEAFTADTAAALSAERSSGAEVPFELVETETRRGSPPLYCYRSLTGEFIEHRMGMLSGLSSYAPAARALATRERIGSYLLKRGLVPVPGDPRERADAVLMSFLNAVFAERSDFELDPGRFEAAYAEIEQALLDGRAEAMVIVPLFGLGLEERSWHLELADGLSLTRGERLDDAPPEAVWDARGEPHLLAVHTVTQHRAKEAPLGAAAERFRLLLSAIRLFERGRYSLGPLAWTRIDFGPWRPIPLPGGLPRTPNGRTVIPARHEDELRGFCNLMARRLPALANGSFGSPELAWAHARFEMACDRSGPLEALTDYLLALRALLEADDPGSSRMPQRLALICAQPDERAALAERVAEAISLERSAMAGMAAGDADDEELVGDMAEHLRALLRDVLCGHLDPDLVGVAERMLAEELAAVPA